MQKIKIFFITRAWVFIITILEGLGYFILLFLYTQEMTILFGLACCLALFGYYHLIKTIRTARRRNKMYKSACNLLSKGERAVEPVLATYNTCVCNSFVMKCAMEETGHKMSLLEILKKKSIYKRRKKLKTRNLTQMET